MGQAENGISAGLPAVAVERGYTARELVLCTFPHRDPGSVPSWSRRNGHLTLILQPGIDPSTREPCGYPYGSLPRLFSFWLIRELIAAQSPCIRIKGTFNAFMRKVGVDPNTGGGKRSDAKRLRQQLMRFLRCRISFVYEEGTAAKGRLGWQDMTVASKAVFWWDYRNPEQDALFESTITVSEEFYRAVTQNPVPVDLRALRALKRSPFALDLYAWATYRVYTLGKSGAAQVTIPLEQLREQFGAEYGRPDHFKAALAKGLAEVRTVFPELDYQLGRRDLVLRQGKVPISERTLPELYGGSLRGSGGLSLATEAWFLEHYGARNFQTALRDFNAWLESKPEIEVKNRNALFKSFVDRWAQ